MVFYIFYEIFETLQLRFEDIPGTKVYNCDYRENESKNVDVFLEAQTQVTDFPDSVMIRPKYCFRGSLIFCIVQDNFTKILAPVTGNMVFSFMRSSFRPERLALQLS